MNLLPKEHGEFVKPEYWEKFFKKRGGKAFEWYGEYPDLCGILHKYIKPQDKLLVVGCGNSQLSADLYDVGHHSIVNVDITDVVIRQMKDKNEKQRPQMKFLKMDVLNLEFPDSEFSVVLDKGTLDALMVDDTVKVTADIERMFSEIDRTLKLMGRYICISLLQEHILKKIVGFFSELGWAVRIHRIHVDDSLKDEKEFHMPVFAIICTKFKKNPSLQQILEVCAYEDKNERFKTVADLMNVVKEMQYYAVIRQRIAKRKVADEQLSLSLYTDVASTPRYTLHIVDSAAKLVNKFAIFIVPQGRETEWMFSTEAGRQQLSESAGFERLVVVTLDRNHAYLDLEAVQAELSGKVMELAPPGFKMGTKAWQLFVPFLSLGNDIGSRSVVKQGSSKMSGEYIIEDVEGDSGTTYRRLVFLSNQNVVQSEARLKTVKKKGKGRQTVMVVDKSYLACQHHLTMVAGLSCVASLPTLLDDQLSVLLIGLGGGGLPSFMHQFFTKVNIEVVDIDPEIVAIAIEWFEFQPDDKLRVCVDDGLKFVENQREKGRKWHVIMLDVDSKDLSVGMSCPPEPFVEPSFLRAVKSCLHDEGALVLNLVCRDEMLKSAVLKNIQTTFAEVYSCQVPDEVNEIIYALNRENTDVCITPEKSKVHPSEQAIVTNSAQKVDENTAACRKTKLKENCQYLDSYIRKQGGCEKDFDIVKEMENLTVR
ncbi:hypothetical protein DPMN_145178 [Dreissena polymorpha]|uniref:Methyltransferase type 11 domain-containing protein n=1 Tax=Dreissena polymorpha TaxID=45954 RepID=A0A9D4J0S4_DREPO|nr:hypothetical protein DPMN_145178 [Dreissena polymorpha]